MQTVGSFQAKTHFSALLETVERGNEVVITKHGRIVAKLVPTIPVNQKTTLNTIAKLQAFAKRHYLGNLNWKDLRDEGRRHL